VEVEECPRGVAGVIGCEDEIDTAMRLAGTARWALMASTLE
jgi:hypothetical protein